MPIIDVGRYAELERIEREYNELHFDAKMALPECQELLAEAEHKLSEYRNALELIASTDPVDAALDPDRAIRVAKHTIGEQEPDRNG